MTTEPDPAPDGYCPECGDEFHLDDTGGYNPPCTVCGLCRSCCESHIPKHDEAEDWPDDD